MPHFIDVEAERAKAFGRRLELLKELETINADIAAFDRVMARGTTPKLPPAVGDFAAHAPENHNERDKETTSIELNQPEDGYPGFRVGMKEAVASKPDGFTIDDIAKYFEATYPQHIPKRAQISSEMWRMNKMEEIYLLREAPGNKPSLYAKGPRPQQRVA